ncbi:MAG: aldose 1-epimerase family protein [Reichenbachiella sp.]
MIYSIENEFLRVEIQQTGAELKSIKSIKTGKEYIWQADPNVWGSSAPVLFPNIGFLKNGEMLFDGAPYKLPKHGIVRGNEKMVMINRNPTRLTFLLSHSEETMSIYPFKFDFKISFILVDHQLQVLHEIVNLNDAPMYFSLGGHPGFNLLWNEGEKMEDYYLEFEQEEHASILQLNDNGMLSNQEIPYLKDTKVLNIEKGMFDHDALIFTSLNSGAVAIKSRANEDTISFVFDDFPFLGIWSKPDAPYVCLEPWDGLPDFEDHDHQWISKIGNAKLLANNAHYASYTIGINEC